MKHFIRFRILVVAAVLVCGAGSAEAQISRRRVPSPPPAPAPIPAPLPVPAPQPPQPTADDLFDPGAIQEVSLTVNTRDWEDLKTNVRENTYYLADLRWRGLTVRNIGIRTRGRTSRSDTKPGLRLDFDRYSSDQEFLGLKSVVLDNHTTDAAMLKERVAMTFFTEMKIPAPRVVHARLTVNNRFAGLYSIVEPIDKTFLKRHFGENDGYLYEFQGVARYYDFGYLGDDLDAYPAFFAPKTRETASVFDLYHPVKEMLYAFSRSDRSSFVEAASSFVDLRAFLTYAAVDSFLAERDGLLGEWGMNNLYLYRPDKSTRFQLLPWDRDSGFFHQEESVFARVETNILMRRALEYPELRAFYHDALRRCANLAMQKEAPPEGESPGGAAGPEWLERQIRSVYEQIRSSAAEDPLKPYTTDQFEQEVSRLLAFARRRAASVLEDLARDVIRY